jgi:hypothetical protein
VGLLDSAVAIANTVTQSLGMQATVTYETFVSADGAGKRTYATPVSRKAVVIKKQQMVKTADGQLVMSQARIVFLTPSIVGEFDRITLPDGTTGPILNTEGFIAEVNPILNEVFLG